MVSIMQGRRAKIIQCVAGNWRREEAIGTSSRRWENVIRMDFRVIGWEGVSWSIVVWLRIWTGGELFVGVDELSISTATGLDS
jgi:hypothetical protein